MSRDVSLFYNPVTMEEADKLTPNFPWTKFFESQGVAAQEQMSLAIPAFHEEVDEMLADTAPASWQAYLRFHPRSEEHTSELQSLMRISYAVFCLKKKTKDKLE